MRAQYHVSAAPVRVRVFTDTQRVAQVGQDLGCADSYDMYRFEWAFGAAFLRVEECAILRLAAPIGAMYFLECQGARASRRIYASEIRGLARDVITVRLAGWHRL